jgi:hypothetical protein
VLPAMPLHHLARKSDVENAEIFIDESDLHARDEDIHTLGWTAKFGKTAMVELIMGCGAKPELAR